MSRKIREQLPPMVSFWDAEHRCRAANRAFASWLERDPEEVIGKHARELFPGRYEVVLPNITAALRGQEQVFYEQFVLVRGEAARRCRINYVPQVVDGVTLGFTAVTADVSARQLPQVEARRQLVYEGVVQSLAVSPTFERGICCVLEMMGRGLGCRSATYWEIDSARRLASAHTWSTGAGAGFVAASQGVVVECDEGLLGRVWATGSPLTLDDAGCCPRATLAREHGLDAAVAFPIVGREGVIGVVELFAENRDAMSDDELIHFLVSIGTLIDQFWERTETDRERDKFFLFSLDMLAISGPEGYFKRVNPAWSALGYTEDELCQNPFIDFIHVDDMIPTLHELRRLGNGLPTIKFECRFRAKNGSYRWLRWSAAPDTNGNTYTSASDVTRERELEQELRAAIHAAELATQAKGQFLANVSHEIRTPMNGIIGLTGMALRTTLTPEQRDYLSMVSDSAENLMALINDLLDFEKIEAGRFELDPVGFNLREELGNVMKALAFGAHQKGLELNLDIDPDVIDTLRGDTARIRQVLVNLVGNAVKFTARGEVNVRVRTEAIEGERVWLELAVRDTGVGIPADKHARIFEAFTQADSSVSRRFGGTGLGLSICTRLAKLMNGRLWVDSELGCGSTFYLVIELARDPSVTQAAPGPTPLEGVPVLVVDDNRTSRATVAKVLASWGMEPTTAADASDALDRPQRFAVAVIDVEMPERDGVSLATELRARGFGGPIVMMRSSREAAGLVDQLRAIGIEWVVAKPLKHSELAVALTGALAGRVRVAPASSVEEVRTPITRKILLAEDNVVNQRLAMSLLTKRGHAVTVVDNGWAAIARSATESFDLILMDLQMPELGGLEATAAIRERERTTGGRIFIVAMTAHSMKSDRERCLAAGMDGYLNKPIDRTALYAVVEGSLGEPVGDPGVVADELLNRVGNDRDLLRELVELFVAGKDGAIHEISAAIDARNADALARAAHGLKGSVRSFTEGEAAALTIELEATARAGNFSAAAATRTRLESALGRLGRALQKFVAAA